VPSDDEGGKRRRAAKGEHWARRPVRRGGIDGFKSNPPDRVGGTDSPRHRERCRRPESKSGALHRNAVHPDHARLRRRPFSAVVIDRVWMLVDGCVRVMRAGMVPMLRRQRRGQRHAGHQRKADDCGAQSLEHRCDYGRRQAVRQTLASPVPRDERLEGPNDRQLNRRRIEVHDSARPSMRIATRSEPARSTAIAVRIIATRCLRVCRARSRPP